MARCTASTVGAARTLALLVATFALHAAACSGEHPEPPPAATADAPKPSAVTPAPAAPPQAPKGPPVRLFASQFVVNIREQPSKEAFRMGYLRGGAVVQATTAEPIGFDKCRKGWFPLEGGGFVCSTVDAIAFTTKRLPERPSLQADLSALLPYPYGYSRRRNTPMYRRIPTAEEAALYEGLPMPTAAGAEAAVTEGNALTAPQLATSSPAPPTAPSPPAPPAPDPLTTANGEQAAADAVPTLASLQGEQGGVLMRRMERGFYVSLDHELRRGGRGYYRTQSSGFIPSEGLAPVKPAEFHGVELSDGAVQLPVAFVMSSKDLAYQVDSKGRIRSAGKPPGYHFMFRVVSEADVHGKHYLVGEDGRHYRASEVARIDRRDKPAEIGADEKWLDVDLTTQSLVAYVGDRPVYATLVSTGRIKDELDPQKNFATPTGAFRITSKHVTATMDGDHAIDGPYSIEDVPYVMYFELAYALHGAFWHNGFGRPRSHGCVNLAPLDARWVFTFADPKLPVPWHGVYPTKAVPGTRLYIHGVTPEG